MPTPANIPTASISLLILLFNPPKKQAALRINENASKINQLREEQEECETKLEKERDIWAAEMFELIAEENNMASYVSNYIQFQKLYYKSALDEIDEVMQRVQGLISKYSPVWTNLKLPTICCNSIPNLFYSQRKIIVNYLNYHWKIIWL